MPSDQPPPGRHISGINNTRTHSGGRGGAGGGLTVLEGAAMVSISSWVTHTLPDGYRAGGAGPKRQSSGGLVVGGPVGGASSVKEEEQHHCKPTVL